MEKEKLLAQTKQLIPIEDGSEDSLLSFLIEDCINRVKGYCRISDIPSELETVLPLMAARYYSVSGADGEQAVQSISQGQRSVTYESAAVRRDDWLNDFKSRLDPFVCKRGLVPSDVKE